MYLEGEGNNPNCLYVVHAPSQGGAEDITVLLLIRNTSTMHSTLYPLVSLEFDLGGPHARIHSRCAVCRLNII